MAKFSGTNRRPLRTNLTAPIRTRAGAPPPTRAAAPSSATPSRTCSCSPPPTWSARTRSTSAPRHRDARFVDLVHEVTAAEPGVHRRRRPPTPARSAWPSTSAQSMLMRSAVDRDGRRVRGRRRRRRPVGRGARPAAGRRAGRAARLLAHPPRPQRAHAGQARHRRRGATPLHRARRAALRRPVAPDPHGRRHRAHPPVAPRRAPVGAVPLAARPSSPRRRRGRPDGPAGARRRGRPRRGPGRRASCGAARRVVRPRWPRRASRGSGCRAGCPAAWTRRRGRRSSRRWA